MQNICLITHHPFWKEPLGCGALIRARYEMMKKISSNVLVLFVSFTEDKCPLPGGTLRLDDEFNGEHLKQVRQFLKNFKISICYFSYDNFSFLTEYTECLNLVEIHDVMHLRAKSFAEFGYEAPYNTKKKEEIDSLYRYDRVLCINLEECDYLLKLGLRNVSYFPPSLPFQYNETFRNKLRYGMIGSNAKPNIDGLNRLSDAVRDSGNFVLAGRISTNKNVTPRLDRNVVNLGIINNLNSFYDEVNVCLSPVLFGGGLKIKVLEALSFGRPVLASEHSVGGFPKGIHDVTVVNGNVEKWSLGDISETNEISRARVKDYFMENFSEMTGASRFQAIVS